MEGHLAFALKYEDEWLLGAELELPDATQGRYVDALDEPTQSMNLKVKNDTADWHRYFDATPHVEFLFGCVEQTIAKDLLRPIS